MYPSSSKHWFIIIMGIINGKAEGDISLPSHAALFISRQQRPLCIALFLSISDYEIQAGSCMSVKLHALRSGFSTLTVTYQYKEIILKASVTVGAYHPLKVSCNSVPDDNVNCMVTVKRFIQISLQWPIRIINPIIDKTKLFCYTAHQCGTTVSLETYCLYS